VRDQTLGWGVNRRRGGAMARCDDRDPRCDESMKGLRVNDGRSDAVVTPWLCFFFVGVVKEK
jgi:hypothetical protein